MTLYIYWSINGSLRYSISWIHNNMCIYLALTFLYRSSSQALQWLSRQKLTTTICFGKSLFLNKRCMSISDSEDQLEGWEIDNTRIISINLNTCFFGSVFCSIIWYSLVLLLTLKTFPLFKKNVSWLKLLYHWSICISMYRYISLETRITFLTLMLAK